MNLDKYRFRRVFAATAAIMIHPVAWPGWIIEGVVHRWHPEWEFDSYTGTPYFVVVMTFATAGLVSENAIWIGVAAYIISATEILALWLCLTIALGRSGAARKWLSEFGRRRKQVTDGTVLLNSTALYVGVIAYLFTIYFFACAAFILNWISPSSYGGSGINAAATALRRLWDFFYFSVVTIATVGYGDMYPVSATAKLFAVLEIGVGIFFIVFLFGTYASHRVSELTSDRQK
jgi:hypothetical protein